MYRCWEAGGKAGNIQTYHFGGGGGDKKVLF